MAHVQGLTHVSVLLVGVEINVKHVTLIDFLFPINLQRNTSVFLSFQLCAALDVKMVAPVQTLTHVNVLLVGVEINVKHVKLS